MKLILTLGLLLAANANANSVESVFLKDSALPLELKERILATVQNQCSEGVNYNGLTEEFTQVEEKRVDQGVIDYFYTTTFRTRYYFDGMHPTFAYITVKSAEYAISNPAFDRFEIQSVGADAPICQ